ncbi:hypothetical protein [Roseimaritima multifibrata]|nr:hypothetical protein [Roseimaritima multifibrata]
MPTSWRLLNGRFSLMNNAYEGYHKLLGISPRDQPPTAYRLLGIDLFESDREVIDAAANKQMGYLQSCCNGKHAAVAEGLLNEVSEARLRLLSPASKTQYDLELRKAIEQQSPDAANQPVVDSSIAKTVPQRLPTPSPIVSETVAPGPVIRAKARDPKKRSNHLRWILPVFVPGLVSILVAWQIGLIDFGGSSKEVSQKKAVTSAKSPSLNSERSLPQPVPARAMDPPARANSIATTGQPDGKDADAPPFSPNPNSAPASNSGSPTNGNTVANSSSSTADDSMAPSEDQKRLDSFREMSLEAYESGRDGNSSQAAYQSNGQRLPVPENELKSADRSLQETLASQIRDAKSPHDKQHLATVCYELAMQANSAGKTYVLLQMAQDYFVEGNDCLGALRACDERESRFEVDLFSDRIAMVKKLVPAMYRPLDQVAGVDRVEAMIEKAIQREEYDAAIDLSEVARKIAVELKNIPMSRKFAMQMDKASLLQKVQPKVEQCRLELQLDADDAVINEYLGRVLCFGKSDWAEGLPLMQRGENAKLVELATLELKSPTTGEAMEELAARWWDLAMLSENDAILTSASQERAVHWYRRSIAAGLSGEARTAARSRLDQYESEHGDEIAASVAPNVDLREPKPPRGVPPNAIYFNGNWYLFSEKKVRFKNAVAAASKAGGRLVVVRSQAEHDFLVEHSRRPLMLGMLRRGGVWYDSLGEKQYFFLWDRRNRQPEEVSKEIVTAINDRTKLWHDWGDSKLYFAIEWGKE